MSPDLRHERTCRVTRLTPLTFSAVLCIRVRRNARSALGDASQMKWNAYPADHALGPQRARGGGLSRLRPLLRAAERRGARRRGVYVVYRDSDEPPHFLEVSSGGHFKGKDPTVPVALLQSAWVSGVRVLNVGKAIGDGLRCVSGEELGPLAPAGEEFG